MSKYESAKLILELYDLRREDKMREARTWWFGFKPKSAADVFAAYKSPESANFRMVVGYWEMAAALVNHGAIDTGMFFDTNGEFWVLFARLQPYLKDIRQVQPEFLKQLEMLITNIPGHQEKLDNLIKQFG